MAMQGLRLIANKGSPTGHYNNGRDWFFIGDYGYRNGAIAYERSRNPAIDPPKMKRTGPPAEIASQRARTKLAKARARRSASAPRLVAAAEPDNPFVTCYSELGRVPGFDPDQVLAPKSRAYYNQYRATQDYVPGGDPDSSGGRYRTTSSLHGRIPGFSLSEEGAPSKHKFFRQPFAEKPAEKSRGDYETTYSLHGRIPGWADSSFGVPDKFVHHSSCLGHVPEPSAAKVPETTTKDIGHHPYQVLPSKSYKFLNGQ